MAQRPKKPKLLKPIPDQSINANSEIHIDISEYFDSPDPEISGQISFNAELPKGLECSQEGIISGSIDEGTEISTITIHAKNKYAQPLSTTFKLQIQSIATQKSSSKQSKEETVTEDNSELFGDYISRYELKSQVWDAIKNHKDIPDIGNLFERHITPEELYHLFGLFATMTIWDVYNLEPPGEKQYLKLEGMSEHFNIIDRGSCIIISPKELFSHKRTLLDAIRTAQSTAREIYQRKWTVEFSGFDKMVSAAWVELQNLRDIHGEALEIIHYEPSNTDVLAYENQKRIKP